MIRTFLIAAAALALTACQQKEATGTGDAGTTNDAVNAAQDAISAPVGQTSAATIGANTTEGFVTGAATSDMYEIQAGQIAQKRGQTAGVKSFGKMMVADHTAMSNEIKPLAAAAKAELPTELDERRKGLIDNLNAADAGEFDRTYLSQQEAAHEEALTLMRGYADNGQDAGLKAAAAKSIPKVEAHLAKVRELQAAPPPAAKK